MIASEIQTRRFWLVTIFIAGICIIPLTHLLRSLHLQGHMINVVLGSFPNFVAGICLPAAVMCWAKRHVGRASGLTGAIVGQALVIGWEFAQASRPGMYFDLYDIIATVLGGLAWVLLWPWADRHLPAA